LPAGRSSEETVSQATARLTADLAHGGKLAGPFFRSLGIEPGSAPGRLLNYCAAQEEVFLELLLEAPDLPVRPEELSEATEILKQFGLASEDLDKQGWLTLKLEPVAARSMAARGERPPRDGRPLAQTARRSGCGSPWRPR
jgi:hypothetical protein